MTTTSEAKSIVEKHIGAEVTIEQDSIIIHTELAVSEWSALQNRIDYRYADHSGENVTVALERELHFVQVGYGGTQVVLASGPEKALEKVKVDEYQDTTHVGSESNVKEHLSDNEVVHL